MRCSRTRGLERSEHETFTKSPSHCRMNKQMPSKSDKKACLPKKKKKNNDNKALGTTRISMGFVTSA